MCIHEAAGDCGADESNVQQLTGMQSHGAQSRLGLAGGRVSPLCHFLAAQVLHLWAVKENPSAQTGVVQQEEERRIHFSDAGETRHTSGE